MPNLSPSVFVFCALACEAKPLVDAWQLRPLPVAEHPFSIYSNDERVVFVTGIGKTNMAGAVGYALALFKKPKSPVLINLGIAGHASAEIGTIFVGHKITDAETGKSAYPSLPFDVPCQTRPIQTRSAPVTVYTGEELFEMEASGFHELAIKFSSSELIHAIKIVSDNPDASIANINEASVQALMAANLSVIDRIIDRLNALKISIANGTEPLYRELLSEYHFTATNALKLKALLQRWRLVKGNEEIHWRSADVRNAKALLSWLEQEIDREAFYL